MNRSLVGSSGRRYVLECILHAHSSHADRNVYLARCDNRPFVLKHVSAPIFQTAQTLKSVFGDNPRVRTHVDHNRTESALIYEFFTGDLLRLMDKTSLSLEARKWILREVGLALNDLHSKQWIHLDVKPDNVMVNWYEDQAGRLKVTRVALADLDHAAKLESRSEFDVRIGNVMWRSPEAQVGRGVGKPSDVFSYGLLCLYVITGIETMHPDFGRLRAKGIAPEVEILSRCITFFGPVPSGLVRHVDDEYWEAVFLRLCQGAALEPYVPRFEEWDEDYCRNLEPETNRLIARMTNLDPAARPSMCEVAEDLEEWAGY